MSWLGMDALFDGFKEMAARADAASKTIIAESSAVVIKNTQAQFQGSHKKGQPHEGGTQPNIVTGYLRRSIRGTSIVKTGIAQYETTVGPNAIYGRRIELGYGGSVAYPYFAPGVKESMPELAEIQARNYRKYLG